MPSRNSLLRALGSALEHLRPRLASEYFTAGQVLKAAGADFDRIWLPTCGLISSRVVLESGHEIECALIGNTNAVGVLSALGLPSDQARFVCLTDGHAWTIGVSHLAAAARTLPSVERQLNRFCLAQIGYSAHLGVCNAMHTAEQRLARWLTTAAELLGQPDLAIAQEELANILGLQRSAVNPVLQRLKGDGLIDIGRGRVRIIAAERLSRRGCECVSALRRALCSGHEMMGPTAL